MRVLKYGALLFVVVLICLVGYVSLSSSQTEGGQPQKLRIGVRSVSHLDGLPESKAVCLKYIRERESS